MTVLDKRLDNVDCWLDNIALHLHNIDFSQVPALASTDPMRQPPFFVGGLPHPNGSAGGD